MTLWTPPQGSEELQAGTYNFPFRFEISGDSSIPPSLESDLGYIRYYLVSTIRRPGIKINDRKRLPIVLIPKVETNKSEYDIPSNVSDVETLCCCCCADGPIKVDVEVSRKACAPGDNVDISVNINNRSSKSLPWLSVVLHEEMTYLSGMNKSMRKRCCRDTPILTHNEVVAPNATFSKVLNVVIPRVGPSFDFAVGKAIQRLYSLGVGVKIPGPHVGLCPYAPFVIGTVSCNGKSRVAPPAAASSSSSSSSVPGGDIARHQGPVSGDVAVPGMQDGSSGPDYLTKLNQQNGPLGSAKASGTAVSNNESATPEYILSTPAGSKKDRRKRNDDADDVGTGDEWTGIYGY